MAKKLYSLTRGTRDVYFSGDQLRVDNYPHVYVKVGSQWMREVHGPTACDYQLFAVSPGISNHLNKMIEEIVNDIGESAIPRREVCA